MTTIKEAMTRDIVTCQPTDNVQEIAQSMRALDIGCMPVVDGDRVIGMVTDRDIVTRAIAKNKDAHIRDIMTDEVISISPTASVDEAAQLMAEHQVRRLPVLENDKLVGFVALADLALPDQTKHEAGQALHSISEPRHL